jgi:DNA-binding transcriptional LysR family regulator
MRARDLEIYSAVMRVGNVSRAAELLRTSQPSVSRAIAALEHACGFDLFDRIRGRLLPTREGRLFYAEVERSFSGLEQLRQTARSIREVGGGTVRVASLSALGGSIAVKTTALFLRLHPNARVSLQIHNSAVVRDLVASGQVDIGLAADEISTAGIEHQSFATPRAICLVPVGHRLATRRKLAPKDLHDERFVALAPHDTARLALDQLLHDAGSLPKIVAETPFSSTIASLVAEGAGIGLVNPLSLLHPLPDTVRIVAFEPGVFFKALLLRPAGAESSRLVSAYVATLFKVRNSVSRPGTAENDAPHLR